MDEQYTHEYLTYCVVDLQARIERLEKQLEEKSKCLLGLTVHIQSVENMLAKKDVLLFRELSNEIKKVTKGLPSMSQGVINDKSLGYDRHSIDEQTKSI